MDGAQNRITRFRVPDGARDRGITDGLREPGYRDRPMPLAGAILWTPVSGAAPALPTIPIFVTQRAIVAMQDHGAATSGACFGLLTGDLFRSPDTGAPFLVVESTIRLPYDAGDDAKTVLLQGWVVAQDALRKAGEQLVGWYRVGDDSTLGLSRAQAEAHTALFPQPWQIVIAVGSGAVATGGVYRPSVGHGASLERLAFYELLDQSAQADGTTQTSLQWTTYRTEERVVAPSGVRPPALAPAPPPAWPAVRPPRTSPAGAGTPPLVLLPDEADGGPISRPNRWAPLRRLWEPRPVRLATYAAVGLATIVGSARMFRGAPSAPAPTSGAPVVIAPPLERLDRAADTLALALAAFDLRARLFGSRQMQCPELARGLVLVEQRWASYNAVRRESGVVLDSARTARDQGLYVNADAVERRFEGSKCPRP
jgi:hypothetical protein